MIYLAAKGPDEIQDYNLNFDEFIPGLFAIDSVDMFITDSGNGESPLALSVTNFVTQPETADTSDTRLICVLFWLQGGTPGVRYRGQIKITDNESAIPKRTYDREFEVEIRQL